ncbi:MAG TPA: trypsin-like peptidase domain-containing protein [Pseudomonadales bacterium]|nr:trypsin-like peptidase domain-containing protein [Pseudomonadales bacterium]
MRAIAGLLVLLGLFAIENAQADVRHAVVQVFNQGREVNFQYPWQNGNMNSSYGTGVIIAGNRILTNAHVVDNSLQLQVRKVGSDRKYNASVAFISDERDLALVSVDDKTFFADTEIMELGALPLLGDEVTTYGFPVGGSQLAITRGIVSRIDYDYYAYSGYQNLVCQIDAAINPGASGGPAIVNGKLAGLNFQGLARAENVAYIIPVPVIETFLKDIQDGKVDGVPEMAFVMQPLQNEQLRQRYGLDAASGGVLVSSLSGLEKEKGLLQVGDVVVAMDGQEVGKDGSVRFATADRIDSNILIARHQLGEHLPLGIIRHGKKMDLDYPLSYTLKDSRIIPGHQSNLMPDYEVIGGLVVMEVNEDMMRGWKFVPPAIDSQRYEYRRTGMKDVDRILLVVSVLPDEINQGYEETRFAILKTANGQPVSNLSQLRSAMRATPAPAPAMPALAADYLVLGFAPHDTQIMFSRKALTERQPVIAERYHIPPTRP